MYLRLGSFGPVPTSELNVGSEGHRPITGRIAGGGSADHRRGVGGKCVICVYCAVKTSNNEGSPTRVAAIDAGSNAIRFVVADFEGPVSHEVVHKRREPIRLGHRVFTHGHLDDGTMDEAVRAFASFRVEMDALEVERLRAVATSATREAANREAFLERIRTEAGFELEPISGAEEARLVHLAVRSRVDLSRGRWILVDLGGGSVEVSLVSDSGILWSESYRIGTVRLLETLAEARGCHDSLRTWVRRQLSGLTIPSPDSYPGPTAFAATGGNIEAIARLALSYMDPLKLAILPSNRLDAVIHLLNAMSVPERIDELRLRPDRADVILPAALVYRHFAGLAHAEHIVVPSVGVKEGVLLDVAAGWQPRCSRGSVHGPPGAATPSAPGAESPESPLRSRPG
ncbi:MAG: hypothetical protein F4107_10985 [Gemmatimonadetes bacterium]|nr:hypothetical protein [Gemmatimonadota bacterium]MYD13727.1 hypothetical protein [Gemmatimonadota bacterium]MYI66436.1 hypothetical protein [Gemmatimonadota bacterium]